MSKSVALIGPMGAGKSTIGRLLAKRLRYPLVDLDEMIVARSGKTIPDIFTEDGEAIFRDLESECLESSIASATPCILATGGGVVMRAENRNHLSNIHVVWLDAAVEQLALRTAGDRNRPLLHGVDPLQRARELDQQRRCWYESCADLRIATDQHKPNQSVSLICQWLSRQ